jgi:AsmA protein
MRRTLILLASLAIIVLGLWGSAVIFLDEERLKSIVTGHMSVQSGRKVDIRGSLSLRLFPRPRIHAQDLVVAAPDGFDGPGLLSADELVMSVRLLPLVRGSLTPREVRLSGATINLYTDEMGSSSVDGLLRLPDAGIRRGAERLATRQMRLEDIRVVINDMSVGRRHVLNMDLVEFDRFAFDEPLEFRFRGNLGDPPVFSMMDIEGLLLVPSTRERPVRLSNMRLTGVLSGSDLPLYLLGHVSMSSVPYFRLELGDGTLDVDGQQLSIDSTYTGSERGHLEVTANADRLALGRDTFGTELLDEQLLPLLRGIDIDIDVRVGELQLAGADMQGISLKLSGRDGFLALDALDGMIPGAVVSGQGGWQLEQDQIEGRVAMALSVDNAGELLAALGEPPVLEGTGQVQWHWIQRLPPVDTARLAEGSFELFEGSVNTQSDERIDFRRLAGDFTYSPGVFDVPELGLTLDDGELLGWLSVSLETDEIGGRLIRVEDGREIGLAGAIDRLELSEPLKSDRRPTTENDSPGNGHSDGLQ